MILLLQLKEGIYYHLILITLFSKSYSYFDRYLEMLLFSYFYPPPPDGAGEALPYLVHTCKRRWAGYGFRALSLKQGIRFHLWLASWVGRLVFLRRNPLRECESLAMRRLHLVPKIFVFPKSLSPWRYFEKLLIIIFMQSETKQGLKN